MQVVYHIGAHVTDENRLLKCLLKNAERLRKRGAIVPAPGRYRRLIGESLGAVAGPAPDPQASGALLENIADDDDIRRLVLSFEGFCAGPRQVFRNGMFYGRLGRRASALGKLFGNAEVEFHMATRNPATFVGALARRANAPDLDAILAETDPARIMWSDVVRQLQDACPKARIVIWCNEDAPIIWGDILHSLAGLPPEAGDILGVYDLLADLLTPDGFEHLKTHVDGHPITSPAHRHQVIEAFLDKFARPEQIEEDVEIPGWTEACVARATQAYHEDMEAISRMDGVETILP